METKKSSKILIFVLVIFLFGSMATAYYFYDKYNKAQMLISNPEEISKNEIATTIDKLGKLIELPDEDATLATILDKEKLSSEEFFKNAENGDKLVVFNTSKLAILYRPSMNKIINVTPLVINDNEVSEQVNSKTEEIETTPSPR